MPTRVTHVNCSNDQHYSFVTGITAGLFTQGDVQAGWDLFLLGHGDRDVSRRQTNPSRAVETRVNIRFLSFPLMQAIT